MKLLLIQFFYSFVSLPNIFLSTQLSNTAYVLPLMRETKFRTHVKWGPVITAFRRGGGVSSNA
jgi:hypothetical protein